MILRLTLAAKFLLDVEAVRIAISSSALMNCVGARLYCWLLEVRGVKIEHGGGCWNQVVQLVARSSWC